MRKIKNNLHSNTFRRTNTFFENHSYEQFLIFMSYHLTIFWSPVKLYLLTFSMPPSLYLSSDCLFHLECLFFFFFFLFSYLHLACVVFGEVSWRKWQRTPVLLRGKFRGHRAAWWGHKELDTFIEKQGQGPFEGLQGGLTRKMGWSQTTVEMCIQTPDFRSLQLAVEMDENRGGF